MGDFFEESEIYHTPFGTTNHSPFTITPDFIETTTLGDPFKRYTQTGTSITYTGSTGEQKTIYYPAQKLGLSDTFTYEELMRKLGKEEEANVKLEVENFKDKHVVYCKDNIDLSPEKILLTLSATKGRLMLEVAPIHIKEFQCSMTPAVRRNIIQASKRARMYGKKMPIIARFDEYGRPLPEQIEINDSPGVNLKILNPSDVGELYFEMVAIEFPSVEYTTARTYDTAPWEEDLPF